MAERLRIPGANPRSLLGYLFGLGILRVVARQVDAAARSCWRDGALELHTGLDATELEEFLLDRWVPAPVVSPWNGGSGFFPKDNTQAFDAIEADRSRRLDPFREAISRSRTALAEAGLVSRPEPRREKPALVQVLRATLPDDAIDWLDAAIVLVGDSTAFPPVLGSGGNDGRYDIANNYAQAVVFAVGLDPQQADERRGSLAGALWDRPASLRKMSLAHLMRDASPVNSPVGESDALGNPWQLAISIEGVLLLAAGAARRLDHGLPATLVAPFTLRTTAAGYGSAVPGEQGRAEVWLPLWRAPAALSEVEALFREARVRVGQRPARTGLDGARAAAELGVARGVAAFQRQTILERAGLSNLAVPAGKVAVSERSAARLLRTLDPWLDRVVAHGHRDVPHAQRDAIGALERAAFAVAQHGRAADVQALVVALGAIEGALSRTEERNRPRGVEPIAPAAAPWLEALGTDRIETRLAVGLASVSDARHGDEPALPALRDYLHATGREPRGRRRYGETTRGSVPHRAPIVDRLAALHDRRHQDADRIGRADLGFDRGVGVGLDDLSAFARGHVDERELGGLLDGLALFDYRGVRHLPEGGHGAVDPLLAILAIAFHDPRPPLDADGNPQARCRPRPGWVSALRAGRPRGVAAEALLRLRLAGLPPVAGVDDLQIDAAHGPRVAAALLAHPRRSDIRRAIRLATLELDNPAPQETTP